MASWLFSMFVNKTLKFLQAKSQERKEGQNCEMHLVLTSRQLRTDTLGFGSKRSPAAALLHKYVTAATGAAPVFLIGFMRELQPFLSWKTKG